VSKISKADRDGCFIECFLKGYLLELCFDCVLGMLLQSSAVSVQKAMRV